LENGAKPDDRQRKITIRHLLQHRGGWDRDKSFDAMFQQVRFARALGAAPPAGHAEIIRCMLGVPLDFDPGERHAYSNYGYCLLGRVIEKVSGQPYDDYVKQHVLKPLGIKRMVIGATHPKNRREGEVRYYDAAASVSVFADTLDQPTPPPYGAWCLEVMDSHGAWLASAPDLVRFASAFDDSAQSPLLKKKSINLLFERPEGRAGHDENGKPARVYYGLGWQCQCGDDERVQYQMHGGSLPGTSTKLVRRCDGRNFAVLFNARESAHTLRLAEDISTQINQTLDEMDEMPDIDFFQKAGIWGN
jgi:N-acyl-D-amino-acid deacylase